MPIPFVSLLTDFGMDGPWVAICKGVILSLAPDVRFVDISHEVPPFAVRAGAFVLAAALPELPVGVHLAVVDPGVGTARRPLVVRAARGDLLVGPDNGLLLDAVDALGGVEAAHELTAQEYRRATSARTFHGRDIFAPAVGHLLCGVPTIAFGPALATSSLVRLAPPAVVVSPGALRTAVLYVDRFGNVKLAGGPAALADALGPPAPGDRLRLTASGREYETVWGETFGDAAPGASILYVDSLGHLSLAINQGDAARELGIGVRTQDTLVVRRADEAPPQ
jgi:S-adenosyl-L-methionine hydrolase (adenosine-forming)